jgi:hypothetical protein
MGGVGSSPFLTCSDGTTTLLAIKHSPLTDFFELSKHVPALHRFRDDVRDNDQTKKDSDTPSLAGGWPVLQLAFEQMIYFFADGLKIIQAEIYNGITDVCNLVHFL